MDREYIVEEFVEGEFGEQVDVSYYMLADPAIKPMTIPSVERLRGFLLDTHLTMYRKAARKRMVR